MRTSSSEGYCNHDSNTSTQGAQHGAWYMGSTTDMLATINTNHLCCLCPTFSHFAMPLDRIWGAQGRQMGSTCFREEIVREVPK